MPDQNMLENRPERFGSWYARYESRPMPHECPGDYQDHSKGSSCQLCGYGYSFTLKRDRRTRDRFFIRTPFNDGSLEVSEENAILLHKLMNKGSYETVRLMVKSAQNKKSAFKFGPAFSKIWKGK